MDTAASLIQYEDTVLHDQWKAGGGSDTFFGSVVTDAEYAAQVKYVELANPWLTNASNVLSAAAGTQEELATLARLFPKILARRDDLVRKGRGTIPAAGQDAITKKINELVKPAGDGFEKGAKWAAVGLVALLLIVLLK